MAGFENDRGPAPSPDTVAVIGGGRWARVLVDVIAGLVPATVAISVHSRHNADAMGAWLDARGLRGRIRVDSEWPQSPVAGRAAVIVANAARDHQAAAAWAVLRGMPTLVEKPFALTAAAAERIAELGRERNVPVAAAHVFLFARYVENFSRTVGDPNQVSSFSADWRDPRAEERHGELKRYDASVPVFVDWLPHIVPIAAGVLPYPPDRCEGIDVRRGGAQVDLRFRAGAISCAVRLERNAAARVRTFQATVGDEHCFLDCATEPGTIRRAAITASGDALWDSGRRPAAAMLAAFLAWAAGGPSDGRLDVARAIQNCHLIDEVASLYRSALGAWVIDRLAASQPPDEDLRYALAELLQAHRPVAAAELDRHVITVARRCAGPGGAQAIATLRRAVDVATQLTALVA